MRIAMGRLVMAATACGILASCEKARLDEQVRELCAKDGGVKVFETVKLPAGQFDAYARRNWVLPDKNTASPNDDFYIETIRHHYRTGNPEMSRTLHRITRQVDGKVLGEMVTYGRGGGDLPGPWHGSSFTCPTVAAFETLVFTRGDSK